MSTTAPGYSGSDWDPDVYARFATLRSTPFWDLVDLVVRDIERHPERPAAPGPATMVDLGCGSGELTVALARRLDIDDAAGIDSSPSMLERARQHADRVGSQVRFTAGDIGTWHSSDIDLVVANASLQWVPDHPSVLARWVDSIADGGRLAVQVPANADHPSHRCSVAVAQREPYLSALGGDPPPDPVADNVLAPERYSELLHDLGIEEPHVRLQVYPQLMASSHDVVDWVSGTSLTRFFARLPPQLHDPFVADYRAGLLAEIGDHSPYLYTFKRILMFGRVTRTGS